MRLVGRQDLDGTVAGGAEVLLALGGNVGVVPPVQLQQDGAVPHAGRVPVPPALPGLQEGQEEKQEEHGEQLVVNCETQVMQALIR